MALFDELKGLGFVEGQNLKIVVNGFGLRDEQFAEAAATLAKSAPNVIFASVILRCAPQGCVTRFLAGTLEPCAIRQRALPVRFSPLVPQTVPWQALWATRPLASL